MPAEKMNQLLSSWGSIASIFAALLTGFTIVYSIYRYTHRAKFRIIVLPRRLRRGELSQYVRHSGFDELEIQSKHAFLYVKNESLLTNNKLQYKSQNITSHNGKIELPILIQNVGNKNSDLIKLIVRFDIPEVQIIDLHSETFEIEYFYNSRPNEIDSELLKKAMSTKKFSNIMIIYE